MRFRIGPRVDRAKERPHLRPSPQETNGNARVRATGTRRSIVRRAPPRGNMFLMAQRRFHYDVAFEKYLREKGIPYIAVDEAKRALHATGPAHGATALKSFDFVVYSRSGANLLVDVKGRKHSGRSTRALDNWVTQSDVDCMSQWEGIFGQGFEGAFAFLYWCEAQPPDALFQEIFESNGRWYALLAMRLRDYRAHMKQRSPRWSTVNVPAEAFSRLAVPLMDLLG